MTRALVKATVPYRVHLIDTLKHHDLLVKDGKMTPQQATAIINVTQSLLWHHVGTFPPSLGSTATPSDGLHTCLQGELERFRLNGQLNLIKAASVLPPTSTSTSVPPLDKLAVKFHGEQSRLDNRDDVSAIELQLAKQDGWLTAQTNDVKSKLEKAKITCIAGFIGGMVITFSGVLWMSL